MTTRYRVEYALKTHRRDQFIEFIKGLLAVPFVINSQPTGVFESRHGGFQQMAEDSHRRYADIMRDIEDMIDDHIDHQILSGTPETKLRLLVPSIGNFFTRLPLADAFRYQDRKRNISSRRFVPPSFNDVRLILNTAQLMAATSTGPLDLATFDGDVTLYDDGKALEPDNPVIERIISLMSHGTKIGVVTAAGYEEDGGAERYYGRLHGLLEAVKSSELLKDSQRKNLVVMGGESNFLYKFDLDSPFLLTWVPRRMWILEEMYNWTEESIQALLSHAELAIRECVTNLKLEATIVRKSRAVGIVPNVAGTKFAREVLEEVVLIVQKVLEMSPAGQAIPFCAFNGGNDVFVDIGDKSWGVLVCQKYFGDIEGRPIEGKKTVHVGDQFLSANGANDFRARRVGTTAWVASPQETVALLHEAEEFLEAAERKRV